MISNSPLTGRSGCQFAWLFECVCFEPSLRFPLVMWYTAVAAVMWCSVACTQLYT